MVVINSILAILIREQNLKPRCSGKRGFSERKYQKQNSKLSTVEYMWVQREESEDGKVIWRAEKE